MRIIAATAIALTLGVSAGSGPYTPDRSEVLQAFQKRVEAYVVLRDRLAQPLPPLTATADSLSMVLAKRYLASAIRSARALRPGNVFDPPVGAAFRQLISETLESPDFERFLSKLDDRRRASRGIHPLVNEPYPASVTEDVPLVLRLVLPPLPVGLEYRVAGYDLVLLDLYAEVVVDFMPDAFVLPIAEDE